MIEFRIVSRPEELDAVVKLQELVWGADVTPSSQMIASIHHGGVVITAMLEEKLVGFCYGFAGYHGGDLYLASHMAAVHPDHRDLGLGRRLKEMQRLWALENGYEKIVWTFDPLEARNAFLNLCKLGGIVRTYIPSMYGDMDDKINKGLPSDRFLLEWQLKSDRAVAAVGGNWPAQDGWARYEQVFEWNMDGSYPVPATVGVDSGVDGDLDRGVDSSLDVETFHPGDRQGVLIPVPSSTSSMKQERPDLALAWRYRQRDHFQKLFANGYQVVGLVRADGPVHYYALERE
jgi:predicted GNAT superfamily acetyltransferase